MIIPKIFVDAFEYDFGKVFQAEHIVHKFPIPRSIMIYNEVLGGIYATATFANIYELVRFNLFVSDFCKEEEIVFQTKFVN